jgi:hypothetical protein
MKLLLIVASFIAGGTAGYFLAKMFAKKPASLQTNSRPLSDMSHSVGPYIGINPFPSTYTGTQCYEIHDWQNTEPFIGDHQNTVIGYDPSYPKRQSPFRAAGVGQWIRKIPIVK